MNARRGEYQVVEADLPVDIIDVVEKLQPGDTALIYLASGWTPPDRVPPDVIDVIDDINDVQPGDTALIYRTGPIPGLVSGTVASVLAPGRKQPDHRITFTAPVLTDDPGSAQLSVTPDAFIRAYRVNQPRAARFRTQRAAVHAADNASATASSTPLVATAPSIVSGVVGRVEPWGLTWAGHLISYTTAVIDDGSYQFPVSGDSSCAFISAYRATS